MAFFVGDANLMIAKSPSIINQIRKDYPIISEIFEYNRSGTIGLLKANGVLLGYKINHLFEIPYKKSGNGQEVWTNYKTEIEAYVAELCKKIKTKEKRSLGEELGPARKTLAEHIHKEYYKKFPRWPDLWCENKAKIELNISSSYEYGTCVIIWNCIGFVTVTDKTNVFSYTAEINGEPEIKVLVIDHDKLKELLRAISGKTLEEVKIMVDEKERKRNNGIGKLTWENLQ